MKSKGDLLLRVNEARQELIGNIKGLLITSRCSFLLRKNQSKDCITASCMKAPHHSGCSQTFSSSGSHWEA